jgi:hypothetical protein
LEFKLLGVVMAAGGVALVGHRHPIAGCLGQRSGALRWLVWIF